MAEKEQRQFHGPNLAPDFTQDREDTIAYLAMWGSIAQDIVKHKHIIIVMVRIASN